MELEALSSNELLNFIFYDTISATPYSNNNHNFLETNSLLLDTNLRPQINHGISTSDIMGSCSLMSQKKRLIRQPEAVEWKHQSLAVQGKKKRKRKPRVCKNKEEAETQRMTHITVERKRRKQMNEHLAVLRSLMPESYVQRGDQASIVGGAIEFVKELEHLLQSFEVQKLQLLNNEEDSKSTTSKFSGPPFAQFFLHPQYTTWSQIPNNKYKSKTKATIADIEVTLIETHANLRILSRKCPKQISKLVNAFQALHLSILHINITSMDPVVLYSISAKLEEECQLTCVDDIAEAVHQMLRIIEEETTLC